MSAFSRAGRREALAFLRAGHCLVWDDGRYLGMFWLATIPVPEGEQ
jgi:hypothetical protein